MTNSLANAPDLGFNAPQANEFRPRFERRAGPSVQDEIFHCRHEFARTTTDRGFIFWSLMIIAKARRDYRAAPREQGLRLH